MGRSQILAAAMLGLWIGISLFMWFSAAGSFATVDRILQAPSPELTKVTKPLSSTETREIQRHVASEINRSLFRTYNWTQIVLGLALLFILLRQAPCDTTSLTLATAMLLLVLILTLIVTPQIVTLGRSLDFVPRNPPPPELVRFRMLHGAYTVLDGLKLLAGLTLLVRWIARR